MSLIDRFPMLPHAHLQRVSSDSEGVLVELPNRPIAARNAFEEPAGPTDRPRLLGVTGKKLRVQLRDLELQLPSRRGMDLAESEPAIARSRLYLDFADHVELACQVSIRHTLERILEDRRIQAELILEYFWGALSEREWCLSGRADLELSIRLPALAGLTSLADLEHGLRTVFGPGVYCRLTSGSARDAGEMASRLEDIWSRPATPPFPPIIGPAPLEAPVLSIELDREAADETAKLFGFEMNRSNRPGHGWDLARCIAAAYVPVHTAMRPQKEI